MKFYSKVTSKELSDVMNSISAWDGKARKGIEDALKTGTKNIKSKAKQKVSQRTGTLRKKIVSSFNSRRPEGTVRAKTPYAHLVEFGAKAYTVKPKTKKALAFTSEGRLYIRRSTKIPARKGRPFIKPAFDEEVSTIVSDMKKVLRE